MEFLNEEIQKLNEEGSIEVESNIKSESYESLMITDNKEQLR